MSAAPTTRARLRRRVLALLAVLVTVPALVLPTSGAIAAGSVPAAPTSKITVTPVTIAGLPDAAGTPEVLIDAGATFDVTVTLVDGPYSTRVDTPLVIQSSNGRLSGTTPELLTASVRAGQASVTFTGLRLPVANRVVLTVRPVDSKAARELGTGSSAPFDVVTDTELITVAARNSSLTVSKDGSGVPCQPTETVQTCVDVLLPNGIGSSDAVPTTTTDLNVFFSTGSCDGVNCGKRGLEVLQVLADIEGRYTKQAPATLVVKCDKTLCEGGAIQRNVLYASLQPTGALAPVPTCAVKGVIGPDQESSGCVDYVQSKRDGSGDTYLYWLVTRDARFMI